MPTIRTLSEEDEKELKKVVEERRRSNRTDRSQPYSVDNDPQSSDTYVVLTAAGGIAAASDRIPGAGLCDIYQIVEGTIDELFDIGTEITVLNLYEVDIDSDVFALATKDKFGNWWVINPNVRSEPFTVQITGGPTNGYYSWRKQDDTPYGYASNGTTTNNSVVISGIPSTSAIYLGNSITGTGIAAGTTVVEIIDANNINISTPATASGTNLLTYRGLFSPSSDGQNGISSLNPVEQANGVYLPPGTYVEVKEGYIDSNVKQTYLTYDSLRPAPLTYREKSSDFTCDTTDNVFYQIDATSGPITATIPGGVHYTVGWKAWFRRVDNPTVGTTTNPTGIVNSVKILSPDTTGYIDGDTLRLDNVKEVICVTYIHNDINSGYLKVLSRSVRGFAVSPMPTGSPAISIQPEGINFDSNYFYASQSTGNIAYVTLLATDGIAGGTYS